VLDETACNIPTIEQVLAYLSRRHVLGRTLGQLQRWEELLPFTDPIA
jgi:hypothetical protein